MKRKEYRDAKLPGLVRTVLPSGFVTWSVAYTFAGRFRRFTIGDARRISTKTARKVALDIFAKVASGVDPQSEKVKARARANAGLDKPTLFGATFEDYLAKHGPTLKPSTLAELDRISKRVLIPKFGRRDLADMGPREVKAAIKNNQIHSALTGFFNWAKNELLISKSPLDGIRKPNAMISRDRVLTEAEIKIFWKACDKIGFPYGPLFQALLLTGARRGEIAGLKLDYIDRANMRITLPGTVTKNSKELEITITPQLEAILDHASKKDFIFGNPSGWSKAKIKLDDEMHKLAIGAMEIESEKGKIPDWRIHDLRRTAASGMASLGVSLPVIERCLNHISGSFGGIAGVYQRHEFRDEMAAAWATWADHLAKIVQ